MMEELVEHGCSSRGGLIRSRSPREWAQGNGRDDPQRPFRDWGPVVLTKAFQIKNLKSPEGSMGRPRGQQGWEGGTGPVAGGLGRSGKGLLAQVGAAEFNYRE